MSNESNLFLQCMKCGETYTRDEFKLNKGYDDLCGSVIEIDYYSLNRDSCRGCDIDLRPTKYGQLQSPRTSPYLTTKVEGESA